VEVMRVCCVWKGRGGGSSSLEAQSIGALIVGI